MAKRRNERMQEKPMAARRGGFLRQQRRDNEAAPTSSTRGPRDDNFGNRVRRENQNGTHFARGDNPHGNSFGRQERDEHAPRKPFGNKRFRKF